jgi:hypothetical protein
MTGHKVNRCIECNNKSNTEDIITLKTALGYKEKSNGEFRREVEEETGSLTTRISTLESTVLEMNTKLKLLLSILVIIIPIFGALLVEILVKL